MNLSPKEYDALVKQTAPPSSLIKNLIWAFVVGGLICTLGQAVSHWAGTYGLAQKTASSIASISLVFLSALLTAFRCFDDIAKHAGAGTIVPITGFANAVVSPAMEFKTEGLILGMGAKMFIVAGPVLVYGITASVIYGIIYALFFVS